MRAMRRSCAANGERRSASRARSRVYSLPLLAATTAARSTSFSAAQPVAATTFAAAAPTTTISMPVAIVARTRSTDATTANRLSALAPNATITATFALP